MDQSVKDAVLLPQKSSGKPKVWYSPFLDVLTENAGKAPAVKILYIFLAPFVIQYNAHRAGAEDLREADISPDTLFSKMNERFCKECRTKIPESSKDRINRVIEWLNGRYAVCLEEHCSELRLEPYKNIVHIAREMYFPDCLRDQSRMRQVVGFFSGVLGWVFEDQPGRLLTISNQLRERTREAHSGMVLEDAMDPATAAGIALYSAILVSVFPKVKGLGSGQRPEEELRSRLPVRRLRLYPRQGRSSEHTYEITQYIQVVESFPAGSMERHQAMQRLWKYHNYYAGWELYQQYRSGTVLTNAPGTRCWQLDPDPGKAAEILEALAQNSPSRAVEYYHDPKRMEPTYYPQVLAFIHERLSSESCDRQYLEQEILPALDHLQKFSDDAKLLYYLACEKNGSKVNSDFLLSQKAYGNPDIWDALAPSERISHRDHEIGARRGSLKCLRLYLEQETDPDELTDFLYDLLQLPDAADTARKIGMYQVIQSYYDDRRTRGTFPPEDRRRHRDNILLMGCGLRRLQRRIRSGAWSEELRQAVEEMNRLQPELEAWLTAQPHDGTSAFSLKAAVEQMDQGDYTRLVDEPSLIF